MRLKIFFFLVGFFIVLSNLIGQDSERLESKHLIRLNGGVMPAFWGPTISNSGRSAFWIGTRKTGINYKIGLDYARVISRKHMFHIGLERYKTGMTFGARTLSANDSELIDKHQLFYHLSATCLRIGISSNRLKKSFKPPFGPYFGFFANGRFVSGKIKDKRTVYAVESSVSHRDLGIRPITFSWNLECVAGASYPIGERFLFNVSFRFDISFEFLRIIGPTVKEFDLINAYEKRNQYFYDRYTNARIAAFNGMLFNVGLGMLLY